MHYRQIPTMLLVGGSICLFLTNHVLAQTHPGLITISVGSGSSQAETEAAETLVARMLDDGELVLEGSHGDSQLPGRQHEGFGQLHNGVAVYGASISRQTMGGETVSIFGTIYTDIDVNLNPTLSLGDATTRMEGVSGVAAFQVTQLLTILPTLDGSYALAYRITASTPDERGYLRL